MFEATILLAAIAIDVFIGEPPARVHPVVWFGRCLAPVARARRRASAVELALGAAAVAAVVAFALALALALPERGALGFVAGAWLLTSSFAIRGLWRASRAVAVALQRGDLAAARRSLASLCARRADELAAHEVASGAVESVAENASDSVVAPLFWLAVGGVPAALAYRAINTADAMLGYRGRLEHLGKAAARLDDLVNLAPARLTALLFVAASPLAGGDARAAWRAWRRDARRTESPNAGHPMAAAAGALGLRLCKPGCYSLNDGGRAPDAASIAAVNRLFTAVAAIACAMAIVAVGLR